MVLDTISYDRANHLLTDERAVRFIVVQHPFSRLVILWKTIFDKRNVYGKELLSEYSYMRDFISHSTENIDQLIDFRDFVDYLTHETGSKSAPDFRPATTLCEPCTNPFELVIKHEAKYSQIEHLLKLGLDIPKGLLRFPKDAGSDDTEEIERRHAEEIEEEKNLVKEYFGMVERTALLKLKQLYFWDFKLYGYTFDATSLEIGGLE